MLSRGRGRFAGAGGRGRSLCVRLLLCVCARVDANSCSNSICCCWILSFKTSFQRWWHWMRVLPVLSCLAMVAHWSSPCTWTSCLNRASSAAVHGVLLILKFKCRLQRFRHWSTVVPVYLAMAAMLRPSLIPFLKIWSFSGVHLSQVLVG